MNFLLEMDFDSFQPEFQYFDKFWQYKLQKFILMILLHKQLFWGS